MCLNIAVVMLARFWIVEVGWMWCGMRVVVVKADWKRRGERVSIHGTAINRSRSWSSDYDEESAFGTERNI